MVFPYPEFHGREDEDVVDFLEQMELACITNHVVDEVYVLRLLQIFLKGDARVWLKDFKAKVAADKQQGVLTLDRLKQGLLERFSQVEDPDLVWQELRALKQSYGQAVEDYVQVFTGLWDRWCRTLTEEVPPMFVKKSLFIDGLLPHMKVGVELKSPKMFDDAVRIAEKKEAKMLKMRELGMFPPEDVVSANDVSVNVVEVDKSPMRSVILTEPQRPKQVQRGMFLMPLGFFPKSSKQEKVEEKQVNEKPAEKPNESVCLGRDLNEDKIPPVNVNVERKDMHVGKWSEDLRSCLEPFAGEELPKDPLLVMGVTTVKDTDVASLVDDSSNAESDSMHMHEGEDLENISGFVDDEQEDELNTVCPEDNSNREEDGVEMAREFEDVCDVDVQNREDDLVINDFLGQLDDEVELVMEKMEVLSWDASCETESLDSSETREVGSTEEEVHADLVDRDQDDVKDVVEESDPWDIASLDEQEPEIEMDANMLVSVTKASMHVAEILKAKALVGKDVEKVGLECDDVMPVFEKVEAPLDAPVDENVNIHVCENAKLETWASQTLLNWMLAIAMPQVMRTKMYVVGEILYLGLSQEQEPVDDDAWRETMDAYAEVDQDDFGDHVDNVWFALMPQSWKIAMKVDDEMKQFPFDPGGQ